MARRSDDEAEWTKLADDAERKRRNQTVDGGRRLREKRMRGGDLGFGSWAHRPLESEIASDRN